jgi:thioredoxin 1
MKLIKFEKENCSACTMVQNFLDANDVSVEKINPFENPKLAANFMISSVPVTILLDDEGTEVQRSRGFNPEELESIISKL